LFNNFAGLCKRNGRRSVTLPRTPGAKFGLSPRRGSMSTSFVLNGKNITLDADPTTPLLWAIRENAGLHGTKFGCGMAQCGACTVIMEGNAIRSCVTQVSAAQNKPVTTLEGLGSTKKMHKIQQAFVDEQAVQCGYCINGMIMTTKALLDKNPKPSDGQIKEALAGNLCRCGTHIRILRAVKRASGQLA
jgi:nicotinate dehydrogenase subunit A